MATDKEDEINRLVMCGRYRLSRRKQILAKHFEATPFEDDWEPRYNIAPTQPVPVIRQHPKEPRRVLSLMRWGLIPARSIDISGSGSMINARSETTAIKPAFRDPMKFRRCLVPADAFYEWRRSGNGKQKLVPMLHLIQKTLFCIGELHWQIVCFLPGHLRY